MPATNHIERVAAQIAQQRNHALNALADCEARLADAEARLAAAGAELEQLRKRLHDLAADESGPSGATPAPDALAGS